jgi:hypothetical protein
MTVAPRAVFAFRKSGGRAANSQYRGDEALIHENDASEGESRTGVSTSGASGFVGFAVTAKKHRFGTLGHRSCPPRNERRARFPDIHERFPKNCLLTKLSS